MSPAPPQPGRPVGAALALGMLLFVAALPRAPARPRPCATPQVELRPGAPGTLRCDAGVGRTVLAGAAPLLFGQPLDLNRASPAAREAVPGIGPARARAIALERQREPFCAPAELARVRGIGPRTLAGLERQVRAACDVHPAGVYRPRENP